MVYQINGTTMFPTHTHIDVDLRKSEDFLFGIKNWRSEKDGIHNEKNTSYK